jgi:hypothetical protein
VRGEDGGDAALLSRGRSRERDERRKRRRRRGRGLVGARFEERRQGEDQLHGWRRERVRGHGEVARV